jgi:hypothetical protein
VLGMVSRKLQHPPCVGGWMLMQGRDATRCYLVLLPEADGPRPVLVLWSDEFDVA